MSYESGLYLTKRRDSLVYILKLQRQISIDTVSSNSWLM